MTNQEILKGLLAIIKDIEKFNIDRNDFAQYFICLEYKEIDPVNTLELVSILRDIGESEDLFSDFYKGLGNKNKAFSYIDCFNVEEEEEYSVTYNKTKIKHIQKAIQILKSS